MPTPVAPILSVIIVNYKVRYFLEQALYAVRKSAERLAADGFAVEVWVVDNNSADGSCEMVRQKFEEVRLIANADNPGFAKANNQAIRLATGKYVLLLNPDTVIAEDTLHKTVNFMAQHPEAGGLGIRMIDGSGRFLPESKRGFPTPFVAFCKAFGLSAMFPRSPFFNRYSLGYLSQYENHEVEVLAGAFMLMPRRVLTEIGLLDEAFFMYGEDIDLSYRIMLAGYKNYYFAESTIIHYKGESTKKGSLNYVRTFYEAMIIFAKKHFTGGAMRLFVAFLELAIYFRAAITLFINGLSLVYVPLLDAVILWVGLVFIKDFWAIRVHHAANYYGDIITYFNIPLYIAVWLGGVWLSGGYNERNNLGRLLRGLAIGTVAIAAIYGFLDLAYRTSRALILLGSAFAGMALSLARYARQFLRFRNFDLNPNPIKNLIMVADLAESARVTQLLNEAKVAFNLIGTVADATLYNSLLANNAAPYLGSTQQLADIVKIYKINEIIFCAKNIESSAIMQFMTQLGAQITYKIVPPNSQSIIGSSHKDTAGELYTVDIRYT